MWWTLESWLKEVDIIKPIETEIKQKNNPILENVKVEWLWEKSYNQFNLLPLLLRGSVYERLDG
jgi:hypothetical protein